MIFNFFFRWTKIKKNTKSSLAQIKSFNFFSGVLAKTRKKFTKIIVLLLRVYAWVYVAKQYILYNQLIFVYALHSSISPPYIFCRTLIPSITSHFGVQYSLSLFVWKIVWRPFWVSNVLKLFFNSVYIFIHDKDPFYLGIRIYWKTEHGIGIISRM